MAISGLKKITMINTAVNDGLFTELDIGKATQITGDNGAGKTSSLRLIPLFYGAKPSAVSKKTDVLDSFVTFYLPKEDSYIVFDYITTRGNPAHIIVNRYQSESGVSYRFVKGEFNRDAIIKDNGSNRYYAIPRTELTDSLDELGIDYEPAINNITTYRAIIQNDTNKSFDKRYQAYSLCSGSRDLRHIEKITHALLGGTFSVANTKTLFLEILGINPELLTHELNANLVKSWCNDYQGVHEFNKNEELFRNAVLENDKITLLSSYLNSAKAHLKQLHEELEQKRSDLNSELTEKKAVYKSKIEEVRNIIEELDAEERLLSREIKTISLDIEKYEDTKMEWEDADIEGIIQKLIQLPDLEKRLSQQKKRFESLNEKVENIENWYRIESSVLSTRYYDRYHLLNKRKDDNLTLYNTQKEALHTEIEQGKANIVSTYESGKQQLSDQELNTRIKLTEITTKLDNLSPNQKMTDELKKYHVQKNELTTQFQELETEKTNIQHENTLQGIQRDNLFKEQGQNKQRQNELKEELRELIKRSESGNGTLFSYLESNYEGWQDTNLGKVLSETVLYAENLNPEFVDSNNAIFGLQIDTTSLPTCNVTKANDEVRKDKINLEVDRLVDRHCEIEKELVVLNKQFDQRKVRLAELNIAIINTQDEIELCNEQIVTKETAIQRDFELKQSELESEKQSVQEQLTKLTKEIDSNNKSYQERIKEYNIECMNLRSVLDTEHSQRESSIKDEMSDNKLTFDNGMKLLNKEKEDRFANEISDETYKQYKEDMLQTEQTILFLEGKKQEAEQYRAWKSRYEVQYPELKRELDKKMNTLSETTVKLKLKRPELKTLQSEKARIINEIEIQDTQAKKNSEKCNSYYGAVDSLVREYDINFELEHTLDDDVMSLFNTISSKIDDLKRLQISRTTTLDKLTVQVDKWGSGELLSLWNDTIKERNALPTPNVKIQVLGLIIEKIIPQVQHAIRMHAVNMGSQMTNYKDRMISFESEVKRLGKSISSQVRNHNEFKVVESIDIRTSASLSRLDGWAEINNFSEEYKNWEREGTAQLPSKRFFDALENIAKLLSRDASSDPRDLFDIEFHIKENGRTKCAKSDKDMTDLASNGTNLIIQSMLYIALINNQRGNAAVRVTFPTDEVGKLTADNLSILLRLMNQNSFTMVAALPEGKGQSMELFSNLYHLTKTGAVTNKVKKSKFDAALDEIDGVAV